MVEIMEYLDELSLVERAKDGDREALSSLVEAYENKIYRLALRMTGDPTDAEDVLQETFVQVVRHIDSFQGLSAFGTWIYRVASNQALMHIRKKSRADQRTDDMEDQEIAEMPTVGSDWSLAPGASALRDETRVQMSSAIATLPEALRSVFLLRDVEELSTAAVADILEITVPAVKTRLHRARLLLRESLSQYFEGDPDD